MKKYLFILLALVGCTETITERVIVPNDTIQAYIVEIKDSIVYHHKDSVTEVSGISVWCYGSIKIIRGDLGGATINFYADSMDVSINDTLIRLITPTDTIYLKPDTSRCKKYGTKYYI